MYRIGEFTLQLKEIDGDTYCEVCHEGVCVATYATIGEAIDNRCEWEGD